MAKTYTKPKQLRAYLALAWYAFRAQTRNPATFAFGFIFPVVFISIFGLIGGGGNTITVGMPIGSPENVISIGMSKQTFIKLDREDETTLEKKLKQGKIAGIVQFDQLSNR